MKIPRLVLGGTSSGVGKTTITAGLIAALKDRFTLADISEEQLKELRSLEKELGATLMAYSR